MDNILRDSDIVQAVQILAPAEQTVPLVFASPHSGSDYPADFLEASALDDHSLRRSEDSFVDELFASAPEHGAPLLRALFPRAFVDPNREPYELDPGMFAEPLPPHVNTRSPRVSAGLGTIARVVASGAEIYRRKLTFAEAEDRIARYYRPYHRALRGLVDATMERFGCCVLVDCHSMPSSGRAPGAGHRGSGMDVVLGDCFGTACAEVVVASAETALRKMGYDVVRNVPYAGGFTTRHYGRPRRGVHALQVELNRRLYMDEARHRRNDNFQRLAADLQSLVAALTALPWEELRPSR